MQHVSRGGHKRRRRDAQGQMLLLSRRQGREIFRCTAASRQTCHRETDRLPVLPPQDRARQDKNGSKDADLEFINDSIVAAHRLRLFLPVICGSFNILKR